MTDSGHRDQIKTRERVRDLAEVYTHEREVNAMLDLIPDMFPATAAGTDLKFLEPACGSGNFLEEILRRKLRHIRYSSIRSVDAYEHRLLRAVASIYGVDICDENVAEARDRMVGLVRSHYRTDATKSEPAEGFVSALGAIVTTNIVRADMLTEAARTEVIDYQPLRGNYFEWVWSTLDDSATTGANWTLFDLTAEPKRDQVPVHYTDLAASPGPTHDAATAATTARSA